MKRRTPSPALVVSTIALVVACAGTATAATVITGRNVKNSSLTSADIKNRSLLGADMKRGTLTLTTFSKGTQNRINAGRSGGGGSATASEAIRKNGPSSQTPSQDTVVARLSLPAGAYVITAKSVMSGFLSGNGLQNLLSSTESATGSCQLDVGGDRDIAVGNVIAANRPATSTLVTQMTRTLGGTTDAVLACSSQVPSNVTNTSIIATKVASVARTESNG